MLKTITLYKNFSQDIRDGKFQEYINRFPQFRVYKFTNKNKYLNTYSIKAQGNIKDINSYLNSIKKENDVPPTEDKKEICVCGNDVFNVFYRCGAGGSGEYITLLCSECKKEKHFDFDNPNYCG
jgi:hypothetical protein